MEREVGQSGLLAEFAKAEDLVAAARALRRAGLTLLEAYTPFPLPEVEEALALRPSPIAKIVFAAGLLGAVFAYLLQYWVSVVDYPINVGALPLHAAPAFVPITFETMVLFAGFAAFFSFLGLARLPRLWHPVFEAEGFERALIDRFWLGVDARDPRFDPTATARLLADAGALRVVAPLGEP